MANLVELGVTRDGSAFVYDGSAGILQALVLEMRSTLDSDSSLSACKYEDLRLIVSPLWLALSYRKANQECTTAAFSKEPKMPICCTATSQLAEGLAIVYYQLVVPRPWLTVSLGFSKVQNLCFSNLWTG